MSRNEHFDQGARRTDVPLEEFGVPVVGAGEERHLRKFHESTTHPRTTTSVPISSIRGGQHYVDHDPRFVRDPDIDAVQPVRGVTLPDGTTQLRDGHHRLVEAKLRGAKHIDVEHIGYGYGRCLTPPCEYGH